MYKFRGPPPWRVFIFHYSHRLTTVCTASASQAKTNSAGRKRGVSGSDREKVWQPFCHAESTNTAPPTPSSYFLLGVLWLHAWDTSWWCVSAAGTRGWGVRCKKRKKEIQEHCTLRFPSMESTIEWFPFFCGCLSTSAKQLFDIKTGSLKYVYV